ncbi:MAG: ABC transporter permease [Firmicutes bacterium]|nr:ABC transporter permease [Bacillota bacterium]
MARYLIRRLAFTLIAFLLIVTLTFVIMKLLPGEPFLNPKLPAATRQMLRHYYGLDKPLFMQYLHYLKNLCTGNLGRSLYERGQEVSGIILSRFPVSATLGLVALGFALITGLGLGILAALKHNRGWDYLAMTVAVIGIGVPNFVFATLMQYLIGVKLRWLPVALWGSPRQIVMPALALAMGTLALMARLVRTSMLEVLRQDYITTARSKGLSSRRIIWSHALRNALLPVLTILGPLVASIITGTFIIEHIFAIPGLGKYFVVSIYNRDYPLIMGTTIFYAGILLTINFAIDLLYGLIDPRIRLAGGEE